MEASPKEKMILRRIFKLTAALMLLAGITIGCGKGGGANSSASRTNQIIPTSPASGIQQEIPPANIRGISDLPIINLDHDALDEVLDYAESTWLRQGFNSTPVGDVVFDLNGSPAITFEWGDELYQIDAIPTGSFLLIPGNPNSSSGDGVVISFPEDYNPIIYTHTNNMYGMPISPSFYIPLPMPIYMEQQDQPDTEHSVVPETPDTSDSELSGPNTSTNESEAMSLDQPQEESITARNNLDPFLRNNPELKLTYEEALADPEIIAQLSRKVIVNEEFFGPLNITYLQILEALGTISLPSTGHILRSNPFGQAIPGFYDQWGHDGIDFVRDMRSPEASVHSQNIRSVSGGEVIWVGHFNYEDEGQGWGPNAVLIDSLVRVEIDGKIYAIVFGYGHNRTSAVRATQRLNPGQFIGMMGDLGAGIGGQNHHLHLSAYLVPLGEGNDPRSILTPGSINGFIYSSLDDAANRGAAAHWTRAENEVPIAIPIDPSVLFQPIIQRAS